MTDLELIKRVIALLPEVAVKATQEPTRMMAMPEPEPVAWAIKVNGGFTSNIFTSEWRAKEEMLSLNNQYLKEVVPLYTAPPQRELQKLTHTEIAEILCDDKLQHRPELMLLACQEKLLEKNT